jgi:hypothetical protein
MYSFAEIEVTQTSNATPHRPFDYIATFKGYDEGDPIGYGETTKEAIDDLITEYKNMRDL